MPPPAQPPPDRLADPGAGPQVLRHDRPQLAARPGTVPRLRRGGLAGERDDLSLDDVVVAGLWPGLGLALERPFGHDGHLTSVGAPAPGWLPRARAPRRE